MQCRIYKTIAKRTSECGLPSVFLLLACFGEAAPASLASLASLALKAATGQSKQLIHHRHAQHYPTCKPVWNPN